jgi:ribulose-phosphate 3-epimerase
MMPKVSKIRAKLTEMGRETCWIQVDGGIALSTIGEAAVAGADTFVAGSAVYRSDDPSAMVRELRARAEVQ